MDQTQTLAGIDIAIILIYMIGVMVLGAFFGKYVKDGSDFFVASRALPFWAIGMSVVATDIGATDFIGVAGETYNSGIALANFDWIGSMPALVFAAFFFIPYYWRSGVYTIPEFLGQRYNRAVQTIHAAIWGVFLFVNTSLALWNMADDFLNRILGWNVWWSVWGITAVVGIYCFSGGLTAVVMTDVVQMILMFVGGFALVALTFHAVGNDAGAQVKNMPPKAVVTLNTAAPMTEDELRSMIEGGGFSTLSVKRAERSSAKAGGPQTFVVRFKDRFVSPEDGVVEREAAWVEAQTRLESLLTERLAGEAVVEGSTQPVEVRLRGFENHLELLLPHTTPTAFPWTGIVFGLGLVMATAYMSGNQSIVQRAFGARSEWDAKAGMLFAGFLKVFIPIMVAYPGLCAVVLIPDLAKGDYAVPEMMRRYLPIGLRGLMFSAMFAAMMSTMSSTLNSATAIWTTDLYGQFTKLIGIEKMSERHVLIVGRVFTFVFILLSAILSKVIGDNQGLYNFLQTSLSIFQGPVFAILLLGIMWKRATRWGGLAGLVLGVCFTTILLNVDGLFPSDNPFLFVSWWSFVFSMVVTVVVSLVTPPEPDEKIRGLVFGQVMKDGEVQRVLRVRSGI
jgi:Na+/proline symporter